MHEKHLPHAALHAPVAPRTWEVRTTLLRTARTTGRVAVHFQRPVEIVGFRPVVTMVRPFAADPASDPLSIPTLDDIEVLVDINQRDRLTNQVQAASAASAADSFVTLSHLSVEVPRLHLYKLGGPGDSPDLGFEFRWKEFAAGTPYFESAVIALGILAREREPGEP